MKVVAGVDCHKRTHTVAFISSTGELLDTFTIAAQAEGFEEALNRARGYDEVRWGLEGTGFYGAGFARTLREAGHVVYEVPGAMTKRYRRHLGSRAKSDPIDARAIAEVVLRDAGKLPVFGPIAAQESLRLRYDQRDRLVGERSKAINRLRGVALRLGIIDLPRNLSIDGAVKRVLERVPPSADVALRDEMEFAAEDVVLMNRRVARIEAELKTTIANVGSALVSVFGISFILAAGLIGHAGDMQNCRNANAFAMRSGTAPLSCSSGMNRNVRVNPGGNRQLNRALHVAALVQSRSPRSLGYAYYTRKRSEGKTPRAALRSLKRRLATVVYYRLLEVQQSINAGVPS